MKTTQTARAWLVIKLAGPKFVVLAHKRTIERMLGRLRGSTSHAGVTRERTSDFAEISWKPRHGQQNGVVSTA